MGELDNTAAGVYVESRVCPLGLIMTQSHPRRQMLGDKRPLVDE